MKEAEMAAIADMISEVLLDIKNVEAAHKVRSPRARIDGEVSAAVSLKTPDSKLMFSVGQKVVLVDDKWPETVRQVYLQLPVLDTVYVVRAVRVGVKADELIMDMRRVLEPSVLLIGLVNPVNKLGVEAGFAAHRFRALDELKTKTTVEEEITAH